MMSINNARAGRISLFLFLMGVAIFLRAQAPPQFKADMQMSGPGGGTMNGKMYVGGTKVRMELGMGGMSQIMIVDISKKIVYTLMPDQKMYMEMPTDSPGSMRAPKMNPMDPANPCTTAGVTICKRLGTETVNGYPAEKWELKIDGQQMTAWIGTKLRLPIKTQGTDGSTMEFRNIVEGAQPANLFVVPAGYQKMDMGGMGAMMGMGGMAGMAGMSDASDQDDAEEDEEDTEADEEATKDWDGTISEPASKWEEGKGWVMNVTITAKGTKEDRTQIEVTNVMLTVKYTASIPLNLGQPGASAGVERAGPVWSYMPSVGMGYAAANAKPVTYTAEWEYQSVRKYNTGCPMPGKSTVTSTTRGKVEAKGSMAAPPVQLIAGGALTIGPDLRTYGFMVSVMGGEGSEQTTTSEVDHCAGNATKTETRPPEESRVDFNQIDIEDQPLPSSRKALTGTKTIPWPFSVRPLRMDTQATVQWNITPL